MQSITDIIYQFALVWLAFVSGLFIGHFMADTEGRKRARPTRKPEPNPWGFGEDTDRWRKP